MIARCFNSIKYCDKASKMMFLGAINCWLTGLQCLIPPLVAVSLMKQMPPY